MKAIQITKPGVLEIIEKEIPKLSKPDEVLIKVKAGGICGSDTHIYHGTSPVATYPRIPGHEISGEVVEIGKDVANFKIGDAVVVEPIETCGHCYACRIGRPNVCATLQVRGCHIDGGFQEYYVVPANRLFKYDASKSNFVQASLIEPYTIARQIVWRSGLLKGDFVFIMGAGPVGLCVTEMVKLGGGIVMISDFNTKRLAVAKELGADYILNPKEEDVIARVKSITSNMGPNITIDAVCLPSTFAQAVDITSVAGRVMCLGFIKDPSPISQLSITAKELDIKGSRHQTYKFAEVVELFDKRLLHPDNLITQVYNFTEIAKAFEMIEKHPEEVCKVVLDFSN